MENAPGSLTRPNGPLEAYWKSCSVSRAQLNWLATQGYLPHPEFAPARPGLVTIEKKVLKYSNTTSYGVMGTTILFQQLVTSPVTAPNVGEQMQDCKVPKKFDARLQSSSFTKTRK